MAKEQTEPDHDHIYAPVVGVDEDNNEIKWKACRICGEPQGDKG